MAELGKCGSCGAPVLGNAPGGQCMRCLLQLGLSDFPIDDAPEASPGTGAPSSAPTSTAEKPGDRIGRFRLVRPIGEGGFGVVFEAEQEEPVRRRVALKVIKLGMDTKQVVARFKQSGRRWR